MNAYIINCLEDPRVTLPISGGVSVGLVTVDGIPTWKFCSTSYNMYADMASVREGDLVFLHFQGSIFGVFEAAGDFKEDGSVSSFFLSKNLYWKPNPANPNSGWKYHFETLCTPFTDPGLYRRLPLRSRLDSDGKNISFTRGFIANAVFEEKKRGHIVSIPDRWKYPDHARTIRPVLSDDAAILMELLALENIGNDDRFTLTPDPLNGYAAIRFILDPQIVENEKIIEGWLCKNLHNAELRTIFGPMDAFVNNFQMGYLEGIDIFGYCEARTARQYKVIEVKKGKAIFPKDFNQLKGYIDWTTQFFAGGKVERVDGYLVANSFETTDIDRIGAFNMINGRTAITLVQFNYPPTPERELTLDVVS